MFGIDGGEFLVLLAVAAVVLGPERLPQYAQQLARMVRELRRMAQGATAQIREELGPEFDEIDWRRFDVRQYDPRRIVREALSDTWDPDDPLGTGTKPHSPGGPSDLGLDLQELKDEFKQDVFGPPRHGSNDGQAAGRVPTGPTSRTGTGAEPASGPETGPVSAGAAVPAASAEPDPPFDPDAT